MEFFTFGQIQRHAPGGMARPRHSRGSLGRARRRAIPRALSLLASISLLLGLVGGTLSPLAATGALAADGCASPANAIVAENCLPGNPRSEWDVSGAGDPSIQGFATDISVNRGETVHFKVKTDAASYRLDIYRLGYYQGQGARKVATVTPSAPLPQNQPACLIDTTTGLVDCGNWAESASWSVPPGAVSGVYIARLVRPDTGGASHIIFVVRDDGGSSALIFQTSDTTWQAYNTYGGYSLYSGSTSFPEGRAVKVSYNRPFNTRDHHPQSWFFSAEYPMVRFLERNGYDLSYTTGVDTDRRGGLLTHHRAFLSVGHDEYWSAGQRASVEAARDAGVNLAFFSGNEVYWKTRWEASIDGSNTPYRTLVTYKEGTLGEYTCGTKCDPLSSVWTGLWRDGCGYPNADGCRPENALTSQIGWGQPAAAIQVPAEYGLLRFWRNTSIASLQPGQTATLAPGTLGYEWDFEQDQYHSAYPLSRVTLSSTTSADGRTHKLALHRAPSGALVFGAGTIQWAWGLDSTHDLGSDPADPRMQQATVNLLADMGAQATTLESGLAPASASTDRTAPTSTITSPTAGATVRTGTTVTISGTASDSGGGVVAAVEVSTDGGATWAAATGRTSWTYSWDAATAGTVTLLSRAVDDSANLEPPNAGVTVTVQGTSTGGLAVQDTTPRDEATSMFTGTNVTATFTRAMDPATITTSSFVLRDAANTPVPAAVSYNTGTQTAILTPNAALKPGTTYTATVLGGAGGMRDTTGTALASNVTWSFTTATVTCAAGQYLASYYNNAAWSGSPALVRCEAAPLDHDWGTGAPAPGVNADHFSVRWSGNFDFLAGDYAFTTTVDDEIIVLLDGSQVMDNFCSATCPDTFEATAHVTTGSHTVHVEYADGTSDAVAKVDWVRATTDTPPTATINSPAAGGSWRAGDVVNFSGSASDPEDGALPASAFTWSVILHHCDAPGTTCHTHQVIPDVVGASSGSFTAPDHGYPSYLEITLTVTDSNGLTSSTTRRLDPQTVNLTVATDPSGLQLTVDGASLTAPVTQTVIVGSTHTLDAPSPQSLNGTTYIFSSWSDGGAQSHTVTAGASAATLTATFTSAGSNASPSVTNPGNQASVEGAAVSLQIQASDPDDDSLTYTATGLPPGLAIDPGTGLISGTLGYTAAGTYSVTVAVSDGVLTASTAFTWVVSNTNRPPTAQDQAVAILKDSAAGIVLAGEDPDGGPLTFVVTGQPSHGTLSGTPPALTYTPQVGYTGSDAFTFTVSDGTATSSPATVTITVMASCPAGQLRADYFNNVDRSGTPVLSRCEAAPIDYAWGTGSPAPGVDPDSFSVRWSGTVDLASTGDMLFNATADDGMLVSVDGTRIIEQWCAACPGTQSTTVNLTAGSHNLVVEFVEFGGAAVAHLDWQVVPVATPAVCDTGQFQANYYNNVNLSGGAAVSRCEAPPLDYAWGMGSPVPGVSADNFSVRWTGTFDFATDGDYTFTVTTDDGMRVSLDGARIIDAWIDQGATTYTATVSVTAGLHTVTVEFYEHAGGATARVAWQEAGAPPPPPPPPACGAGEWQADYFNNVTRSGSPVLSRCETAAIDDNWGLGSPAPEVSADNFSVRWTGTFDFTGGDYTFSATADDGMLVSIDGSRIIELWCAACPGTRNTTVSLASGSHTVVVEFVELGGAAVARFGWQAGPPPPPTPPSCAAGAWQADYFDNVFRSGTPVLSQCEQPPINADWGSGSPAPGVNADNFSVRWTGTFDFAGGDYTFSATADDGMLVSVDGTRIIELWCAACPGTQSASVTLAAGSHSVVVEFVEFGGAAVARLDWQAVPPQSVGPAPTP